MGNISEKLTYLLATKEAIKDAIVAKGGEVAEDTPFRGYAECISELPLSGGGSGDLPEEALVVTGNCQYRFTNNGWNWFIEEYRDKITSNDITNATYMFASSNLLEEVPFDINCTTTNYCDISRIFYSCSVLKELPKITGKPSNMDYMFYSCRRLREIPDDFADNLDWSTIDNATSTSFGGSSYRLNGCYSLRKISFNFLKHINPKINYGKSPFYNGFASCSSLDELKLPAHFTATWTSNAFSSCFGGCNRLKKLIFDTQEDGTPYSVNWKSQTIDLTSNVGFATGSSNNITNYNSGITTDKQVKDDATYQALKNDPDWFTLSADYSRYNHDSAVETINSLPDTSAYLATAGGTNTIKLKRSAGTKTDGGAINTLTEEEIAVATAKGWTVSLVA